MIFTHTTKFTQVRNTDVSPLHPAINIAYAHDN